MPLPCADVWSVPVEPVNRARDLPGGSGSICANAPFVAFWIEDASPPSPPLGVLGCDHFVRTRSDGAGAPVIDLGRFGQPEVETAARASSHECRDVKGSVGACHHENDISQAHLRVEDVARGVRLASSRW